MNDIAQTNYAAQSAAIDHQAAQVRVQRVQQVSAGNNSAGFFTKSARLADNFAQGIYDGESDFADGVLNIAEHPVKSAMAFFATVKDGTTATLHFAKDLMNAQTRPEALAQLKNDLHNIEHTVNDDWNLAINNPNLAAYKLGHGIVFGAAMVATDGVVSVARAGMFGERELAIQNLYHTKSSAAVLQSILNGVDKRRLEEFGKSNRFGGALYLSEMPDTTLAELRAHSTIPYATIRYSFNKSSAKILDLTSPRVARKWGYVGGDGYIGSGKYAVHQMIAKNARDAGYNVIRFNSERTSGINLAVLDNFDRLLQPQMVVPVPQELRTLTPNFSPELDDTARRIYQ